MQYHSIKAWIFILVLCAPFLLGACGRKGDPILPPGQSDTFKRQYPTTTDPQRGVFK